TVLAASPATAPVIRAPVVSADIDITLPRRDAFHPRPDRPDRRTRSDHARSHFGKHSSSTGFPTKNAAHRLPQRCPLHAVARPPPYAYEIGRATCRARE